MRYTFPTSNKILLTLFICLCLLTFHASATPLEDGKAAFKRLDYKSALNTLLPIADQGNADAQLIVGTIYMGGLYGVAENHDEAMKWLLKAAQQGNPRAARMVAAAYEDSDQRNEIEAKKWNLVALQGWSTLAEEGNVEAQMELATLYEYGTGIKRDYEKSYFWYTLAASDRQSLLYDLADPAQGAMDAAKHLDKAQKEKLDRRIEKWKVKHKPMMSK